MDLKDLFKKKSTPENDGTVGDYIDKYYLSFPDLDGEPSYELHTTLTVGSSIGDIIIGDEDISPKHCTFTLNQDVVSLIDYGSLEGTYINKKKIEPGRYFILQETDKLKIGELELVLEKIPTPVFEKTQEISLAKLNEVAAEESADGFEEDTDIIPELPPEATQITKVMSAEDKVREVASPSPVVLEEEVIEFDEEGFDTEYEDDNEDDDDVSNERSALKSANSLIRVIAILADILIVAILLSFIGHEPVLKAIVSDVFNALSDLLFPLYKEYLSGVIAQVQVDIPALGAIGEELVGFFKSTKGITEGIFLFFTLRVLGSLILGVSFGQLLLGIHSAENQLLRRVKGPIRELLGIITFPFFIVFDIMTLFSKRSFKEVVTFSLTAASGKIKSLILVLIFIPMLLGVYLITPMLQGFDFKNSVESTFLPFRNHKEKNLEVKTGSLYLGIKGDFSRYRVAPQYKVIRQRKRKSLNVTVELFDKETSKKTTLSKTKEFSLKKVLKLGVAPNLMGNKKFHLIKSAASNSLNKKNHFKERSLRDIKLQNQILDLVKASFELSFEKLPEHFLEYGPFLKGFIALRDGLEQVIEEEILSVENISSGNDSVLVFKTPSGLSFFDLENDRTNVYKTNLKQVGDLRKFLKNIELEEIDPNLQEWQNSEFSSFTAMDFITSPQKINADLLQMYYEFLYTKSAGIINLDNKKILRRHILSLKSSLNAVKATVKFNIDKFEQNLSDLIRAIEEEDPSYFSGAKLSSPLKVNI